MNTKTSAVYHAVRVAHIWANIGIAAVAIAIGLVLYIGWLHSQIHNCYSGSIQ